MSPLLYGLILIFAIVFPFATVTGIVIVIGWHFWLKKQLTAKGLITRPQSESVHEESVHEESVHEESVHETTKYWIVVTLYRRRV